MRRLHCDIVVAGAGGCGMTAALVAAEHGADVVLVEKDWSALSNTEISSFTIAAAGTRCQRAAGIDDTPERMADDILRKNGGHSDVAVTLALCRTSADVVHWLADSLGYNLELALDFRRAGLSVARLHSEPRSEGGRGSMRLMRDAVRTRPRIRLLDHCPASGLLSEGREVRGVRCADDAATEVIAAKTILACGGFGANRAMVAKYCPDAAPLHYIGATSNTGEAIEWAEALGAALDHMTAFQGHAQVVAGFFTRLSPAIPLEGGFIVNADGARFAREDVGYSEFAPLIAQQPGGFAIEVFDDRIRRTVSRDPKMVMSEAARAFSRHDTLEDLARAFDIPADALVRAAHVLDAAARTGRDEFGRTTFGPPLQPPYFAARLVGGLAHTQGGVRVDPHARVLDGHNEPIPNLYAGGGTACGVSGDGVTGYSSGNGLLAALGLGMIAARDAVAALRPTRHAP